MAAAALARWLHGSSFHSPLPFLFSLPPSYFFVLLKRPLLSSAVRSPTAGPDRDGGDDDDASIVSPKSPSSSFHSPLRCVGKGRKVRGEGARRPGEGRGRGAWEEAVAVGGERPTEEKGEEKKGSS